MHISPKNYPHLKEVINSWFTERKMFGFHAPKLNVSGYLKGRRDLFARNTFIFGTIRKDERFDADTRICWSAQEVLDPLPISNQTLK